jgi:hypothetical protein
MESVGAEEGKSGSSLTSTDMTKGKVLGCLTYIVIGFVLMFPLGMLFDGMNWPLFHFWALAHGSFVLAWPMLTLLAWVVDHFFGRAKSK